ncbi:MAG: type II secretion system protein GspN [Deltaproteobacteria bacterium]|nr:type II secretion system protein GspN [Deltaproteobacteria bacterium]
MKILKNNILWYTLYGVLITMSFLYLLFPSDIAKSSLEEAVNSSGFILKTGSLKPSLPFGLKMKKITLSSGPAENPYFQGDVLDVQFNPLNFFKKSKTVKLSGKAYGGNFSGRFKTASSRIYPPQGGNLRFENIDLGKYTFLKALLGKEITGKAKGSWSYGSHNPAGGNIAGTIALFLNKGTYPLAEPFLGLNRIDFDGGEIQARLENGTIRIEKLQISGQQINCFLNGDILLADEFKNSQLNLKGEMVISDRKVKMNITIEGTLANPALRYI